MFHVEQIDVLAARRKAPEKPGVSRETFRWERFRRLPYLGIARGHPQKRAVIVRRMTLQGARTRGPKQRADQHGDRPQDECFTWNIVAGRTKHLAGAIVYHASDLLTVNRSGRRLL
jgi:hypothetical protein